MKRLGILGVSGSAGRSAVEHHAYLDSIGKQDFELTVGTGSGQSAGRKLGHVWGEKINDYMTIPFWKLVYCPRDYQDLVIDALDVDLIASKCDYVISAIGSNLAKDIEPALAERGVHVFSNASAHRWHPDVPLLVPDVNPEDIKLVKKQKSKGKIVCNPNCTTSVYVPLLKALEDFGYSIKTIRMTTYQALSGAGDKLLEPEYRKKICGNVIDDWEDGSEEWKSEAEANKILRYVHNEDEYERYKAQAVRGGPKIIDIRSKTRRVSVQDGHLISMFIDFENPINVSEVKEQLRSYQINEKVRSLPTTPSRLFEVLDRKPTPKQDVYSGNGMTVVLGGFKQHSSTEISIDALAHNLRRGATWAGRQCLELYLKEYEGMF